MQNIPLSSFFDYTILTIFLQGQTEIPDVKMSDTASRIATQNILIILLWCFFKNIKEKAHHSVCFMAPPVGLEPTTCGLTVRRSTD